jgi:two-component system phosphate regulon response regulator OmpR
MVLFAFDALVVDVMMPGESGLEFVGRLRETSAVPVLMLTAQGDPENRILGLEQGADDYMAKPFEPRELLLRLVSLLRRAQRAEPAPVATASQPAIISLGPASFDLSRMALERDGERVHLTSAEAALLAALATEPGVLLTREDLAAKAGIESESARTVDVQVTRLRRKIEDDPREPRYLHTIRGKGYMLRPG